MVKVICPVCGAPLAMNPPCWCCGAGHSFDVAKQGYVNLLPVQQKHSLHPGDTAEQVHARRRFLDCGFYAPISEAVGEMLTEKAASVLDVGCGEGYYLRSLGAKNPQLERWGIDISRDAVRLAAGADKKAQYLVATAAHLPFKNGCFDAALSLFALTLPEEYARVLADGGLYVQALTEEDHLQGLKQTIYPQLTHREKETCPALPGFELTESKTIQFDFTLTDHQQVQDLLAMTPHFWRITKEGAARAAALEKLQDTAHVRLNLYQKT